MDVSSHESQIKKRVYLTLCFWCALEEEVSHSFARY
ncbi:uncharacterized protein J3R85_000230 [Psidium guajava]|nr:uncharacterized protein J3R85_000230 [Psidium guajava]